jgi:hypothetical protein
MWALIADLFVTARFNVRARRIERQGARDDAPTGPIVERFKALPKELDSRGPDAKDSPSAWTPREAPGRTT